MYHHEEVKSPLSERNRDTSLHGLRTWPGVGENDFFLTMQRQMAGLDTKQMKIIRDYETELDAMKNEIKKIRIDYDAVKQKNHRYRHQLKEKNEFIKKIQDDPSRRSRNGECTWSSEKAKLLTRIKQLEVEKKQADDQCTSLRKFKDENAQLKRDIEDLKFRESLWLQEKERAEKERKRTMEEQVSNVHLNSSLNFDQAWARITDQKDLFSSLPSKLLNSGFRESDDLQDIRKSLNEAREELKRSSSNIDFELESARYKPITSLGKNDSQAKKNEFLKDLEDLDQKLKQVPQVTTKNDLTGTEAKQVRQMITALEAKISNLESNCLTEVQHLVHNVDILKKELLNSQHELQSLKEYSQQMEKRRDEEKKQILNESRELKLDLSSLRSEIRDKSQGSDRTDQSRAPSTDCRDQASEDNFDNHFSPLQGFVGSRCDYIKMKLDTLKKHLKNLDTQTKTVLGQSLTEAEDNSSHNLKEPSPKRLKKEAHTKGQSEPKTTNCWPKKPLLSVTEAIDEVDEEMDGDEIVVVTPRPHRNKFDHDLDSAMVTVENGHNIERLKLPSLEEEEDENDEENSTMEAGDQDIEEKEWSSHQYTPDHCKRLDHLESPRSVNRYYVLSPQDDEEVIKKFLNGEVTKTTSLVHQVDTRFEQLEKELRMQSQRRLLQVHDRSRAVPKAQLSKSAH